MSGRLACSLRRFDAEHTWLALTKLAWLGVRSSSDSSLLLKLRPAKMRHLFSGWMTHPSFAGPLGAGISAGLDNAVFVLFPDCSSTRSTLRAIDVCWTTPVQTAHHQDIMHSSVNAGRHASIGNASIWHVHGLLTQYKNHISCMY